MYFSFFLYIYIYIYRERERESSCVRSGPRSLPVISVLCAILGIHTAGPLQAHFPLQGPTNPRPGPFQSPHRPSRGRQIHAQPPSRALTGLAGVDKSTPGPLTDSSHSSQGTTNPRPGPLQMTNLRLGPLQTPRGPRRCRLIHAWAPCRPLTGLARADKIHVWVPYRPRRGLARVDKSASGPLPDISQASPGPTNPRTSPSRHPTGLEGADKSTPRSLPDHSRTSQGPTNRRLIPFQTPHRPTIHGPRRGRQIYAWAP